MSGSRQSTTVSDFILVDKGGIGFPGDCAMANCFQLLASRLDDGLTYQSWGPEAGAAYYRETDYDGGNTDGFSPRHRRRQAMRSQRQGRPHRSAMNHY